MYSSTPTHASPSELPARGHGFGIALVAPNRGGVLTYASPRNAWLAEPSPEAFAAAIRQAATANPGKQEKLLAAMATANSFRWENVTEFPASPLS